MRIAAFRHALVIDKAAVKRPRVKGHVIVVRALARSATGMTPPSRPVVSTTCREAAPMVSRAGLAAKQLPEQLPT